MDQVELPQRPAAVERPGEDALDGARELAVVAGRRHGAVADVEVDVEVGILDPVRVVEAERYLHELARERRQQVEPLADEPADVLVREVAAGRRRRVVDGEAADVAVCPRRLDRQELGVEARELEHVRLPPPGIGLYLRPSQSRVF